MGKHINTFNNFSINENWTDDDYFKIIHDGVNYYLQKAIDVTDEDLKVVTSCLDKKEVKYEIKTDWHWMLRYNDTEFAGRFRPTGRNNKYIIAKRKGFEYKIFRLEDEWYLVQMSDIHVNLYFLCDQIEGVQYFLNK